MSCNSLMYLGTYLVVKWSACSPTPKIRVCIPLKYLVVVILENGLKRTKMRPGLANLKNSLTAI